MFLSVIAAYVIATAFAFCGVVTTIGYIMESQQNMGAILFMQGLAVAMWPLALAAALVLLVQLACKLERWMLLWAMAQTPATPPQKPESPQMPVQPQMPAPPQEPTAGEPHVVSTVFFTRQTAVTPPVMPLSSPTKPLHSSPEPHRHPANDRAIPLPPRPEPWQESQTEPNRKGLSFFKLD